MGEKPLCGGCGAKVGAGALTDALAGAARARPPRGASPAPATMPPCCGRRGGLQVITTDHLRAFTDDPRLMARIAAIHALGDIWAMGAAPQVALAQVTLPRLAAADAGRDAGRDHGGGRREVFRAAGADIVGGHTSVGRRTDHRLHRHRHCRRASSPRAARGPAMR